MFIKSSTGGFLSKCYFQCALQFLRKNFEHGCDPSTFNGTFNKITITVAEDAFIKVSFPNVRSKQKKINTRNTKASLYHSNARPTQNMAV